MVFMSDNAENKNDIKYMRQAIKLARKAYDNGDVPIGCVIVHEGKVIGVTRISRVLHMPRSLLSKRHPS